MKPEGIAEEWEDLTRKWAIVTIVTIATYCATTLIGCNGTALEPTLHPIEKVKRDPLYPATETPEQMRKELEEIRLWRNVNGASSAETQKPYTPQATGDKFKDDLHMRLSLFKSRQAQQKRLDEMADEGISDVAVAEKPHARKKE